MTEHEQFPEYRVTIFKASTQGHVTWSSLSYDMGGMMVKAGKYKASSASKAMESALNEFAHLLDDGEYLCEAEMKNGMKQIITCRKGGYPE